MYAQVSELIRRFQRAFDNHDWDALRACLDDEGSIDYSSFRGTDPSRVLADVYVQARRDALSDLVIRCTAPAVLEGTNIVSPAGAPV